MLQKYGVENPMQSDLIKNKAKITNLKKYGVENPMQSDSVKDKVKATNIKRYGFSSILADKERMKNSMLQKYGVENPMQVASIFEKAQKSKFKRKEYKWKTGDISIVQGFEPIVLKELEELGYNFNEVLTSPKDMPKITYQFQGTLHVYYPDIFIPKDNIIIEVKSDYTLEAQWDKNQAKFEATKALGFDFRLEVR